MWASTTNGTNVQYNENIKNTKQALTTIVFEKNIKIALLCSSSKDLPCVLRLESLRLEDGEIRGLWFAQEMIPRAPFI